MNDAVKTIRSHQCRDLASERIRQRQWHDRDEMLAALAEGLAHPARVRIVRFLLAQAEDTCICGDICDELPLGGGRSPFSPSPAGRGGRGVRTPLPFAVKPAKRAQQE